MAVRLRGICCGKPARPVDKACLGSDRVVAAGVAELP